VIGRPAEDPPDAHAPSAMESIAPRTGGAGEDPGTRAAVDRVKQPPASRMPVAVRPRMGVTRATGRAKGACLVEDQLVRAADEIDCLDPGCVETGTVGDLRKGLVEDRDRCPAVTDHRGDSINQRAAKAMGVTFMSSTQKASIKYADLVTAPDLREGPMKTASLPLDAPTESNPLHLGR